MNRLRLSSLAVALPLLALFTATCTDAGPTANPFSAQEAARLELSRRTLDLGVGETHVVSATVYASDGTMLRLPIHWSTSSTRVAEVSTDGTATAVAPGTAAIYAKVGRKQDSVTVVVRPITRVKANPKNVGFAAIGTTRQLSATAFDDRNSPTPAPLQWYSTDTSVADVDDTGLVSALGGGSALVVVQAVCCTAADTVAVTVQSYVETVTVSPLTSTLPVGATVALEARLADPAGNTVTGRSIAWTSSNSAVASVSSSGLVTARAAGNATITATADGVSGHAAVTVLPPPVASITAAPAALQLPVGAAQQVAATAYDATGNALTDRSFTWSSNSPGVASVTQTGLVSAVAVGSSTVTITAEGVMTTVPVTVHAVSVHSITVSPAMVTVQIAGTAQLTATLRDSNGNVLTGRSITWSSGNAALVGVSPTGVVTGHAEGSTTVTATSEGKTAQAQVTVAPPPVASITVSPATASIEAGTEVQLSATLRDAAGNVLTNRPVTWSSARTDIATVTSSGRVTGVAAGTAAVSATSEGQTAVASVTVTPTVAIPAPVAVITISPAAPSVQVGGTLQLTATLKDAHGNVLTGRTVSWLSASPSVAAVSASGVLTGVAAGSALITASSEGISDQVTVNVQAPPPAPVATIVISPTAPTIPVGTTLQLSATVMDASGNPLTGRVINWSTSAPHVVSVSGSGLVAGIAGGSATVSASSEGKSATATVTVTAPPPGNGRYPVPAAIDATGTHDVTIQLLQFISSVPDGSTIVFPQAGRYRIEGTLLIQDRHSLTFEGNGSLFLATEAKPAAYPGVGTYSWRSRSQWLIVGGSHLTFRNLAVQGANPNAGLADGAYVLELEAQHGFDVLGVQGLELDRVTITDVYGDFVYLANRRDGDKAWASNVYIHDSYFDRNGRQGIAITAAQDVLIERNYMGNTRRATFDIEPNYSSGGARRIVIRRNAFGPGRLKFLAATGASGVVEDLTIEENTLSGKSMDILFRPPEGSRRRNIRVLNNTSDREYGSDTMPLMYFFRVDGLEVRGNTNPLPAKRMMTGVRATESCAVVVMNNNFIGAALEAYIEPFDGC